MPLSHRHFRDIDAKTTCFSAARGRPPKFESFRACYIVGLGILQVRKRAARMGRDPATGEQIEIKASKKVAFRAAKELKEAV